MKTLKKLLCTLLLVVAGAAWADLSRDDAAAVGQRSGRVLSVEKVDAGGRPAWRVKVVTAQGVVRVILIDARSGQSM